MPTKTINIPTIGLVTFAKSRRAKRLSITLKPFKPVRVAVPHTISMEKAANYLHSHLDWIINHLPGIRNLEQQHQAAPSITPQFPSNAKQLLIDRLNHLAHIHSYQYNRVFIKNQKTRWGSCSSLNNINLNINLINLDQDLIDYVILHELVHTKIKNHSPRFWSQLQSHLPNSKSLNKQLKSHLLK